MYGLFFFLAYLYFIFILYYYLLHLLLESRILPFFTNLSINILTRLSLALHSIFFDSFSHPCDPSFYPWISLFLLLTDQSYEQSAFLFVFYFLSSRAIGISFASFSLIVRKVFYLVN